MTEKNADVVHESVDTKRGLANSSHVYWQPNGQPLVAFRENGVPKWSTYHRNKGWSTPTKQRDSHMIIDKQGGLTVVRKGMLFRTHDAGHTWYTHRHQNICGNTFPHDEAYSIQTGDLRIVTKEENTLTLWTVKLSKD